MFFTLNVLTVNNIYNDVDIYFFSHLFTQLYNFLGYLMDNFTPSSSERKRSCCM